MPEQPLSEPIVIRFDGLDAEKHEIELGSLAESLRGLSRIITVTSHFALTQELVLKQPRFAVRVVAQAPKEGCFIIHAFVQYAHQHVLFTSFASATLAALTSTLISFTVAKALNKKEEMKQLRGALETAIHELGTRDQATVDRLLNTVDKMADALVPAVKHAVAPVGSSARTLTIGVASADERKVVIDEPDKATILSQATLTVTDESTYEVLITELDMDSGSCHVSLAGETETERYAARITDPAVSLPNNAYVTSMAAKTTLRVRAKATMRDGQIERLYISDYEGRDLPPLTSFELSRP
jgi:hypothetical protein